MRPEFVARNAVAKLMTFLATVRTGLYILRSVPTGDGFGLERNQLDRRPCGAQWKELRRFLFAPQALRIAPIDILDGIHQLIEILVDLIIVSFIKRDEIKIPQVTQTHLLRLLGRIQKLFLRVAQGSVDGIDAIALLRHIPAPHIKRARARYLREQQRARLPVVDLAHRT